jgi:hypothetical protein
VDRGLFRDDHIFISATAWDNRAVESRDSMALFRCRLCTTDQVFGYCPSDDTLCDLTGSGFQARCMLRTAFVVTRAMKDETQQACTCDHVIPRP